MDERVKYALEQSEHLFRKKQDLLSLQQEIADHFYPERADFTTRRSLGTEFASHLTTSYPILIRRSMGDAFSAMMRPASQEWFEMVTDRAERESIGAKRWLERACSAQRRAMYDPRTQFTRATKEGDHDFAAFGQCVLSVEINSSRDALLYRSWHLRDVAWCENADGTIDQIYRKWKPTARQLAQTFKTGLHPKVMEALQQDKPYTEYDCLHVVVASEKGPYPWVSRHIDVSNQHLIEEKPMWGKKYIIPRWQTVSGSQYAYSPATVAALPEARLIQAMTRTLLTAGEKYVDPPMLAVQEAIRSDVAIYPGGITWVDAEYDERMGEVLRPLVTDKGGYPIGMELREDIKAIIGECFYLSKLQLPEQVGTMTAYEVSQRVQEYIRNAIPLFEPMEHQYNAALCEETFDILFRNGVFGSYDEIPRELRGGEVKFRFESPLTDHIDRQKANAFQEAGQLLAQTVQMDPTTMANINIHRAFRDALGAVGVPADWIATEEEAADAIVRQQQQMQAQQQIMAAQGVADVAKTAAEAGKAAA